MDIQNTQVESRVGQGVTSNGPKTKTEPEEMSRRDLLATLRNRFPSTSIAIGTLPKSQATQQKMAMAGQLAGITIHPDAAARMQTDDTFREKVVAGVQADQEANQVGSITRGPNGGTTELLAHGTVVEEDGSINGWSLSVTHSEGNDKKAKPGEEDDSKTFIERLMEKMKKEREEERLSPEVYQAVSDKVETMTRDGENQDDITAAIREVYFADKRTASQATPRFLDLSA